MIMGSYMYDYSQIVLHLVQLPLQIITISCPLSHLSNSIFWCIIKEQTALCWQTWIWHWGYFPMKASQSGKKGTVTFSSAHVGDFSGISLSLLIIKILSNNYIWSPKETKVYEIDRSSFDCQECNFYSCWSQCQCK